MSSLFRGEDMTLCQIYFQSEAAYSCIAQLGELGIVQFRDVSKSVVQEARDKMAAEGLTGLFACLIAFS